MNEVPPSQDQLDDVDDHYRQATDAGASIILRLEDRPWGDRCYQVADLEGHQWTFAQHIKDVPLDECIDEAVE